MTLQEAIEQAKRLYPDLTLKPVTARKWTERGLLPSPTIESLGGTGGTRAHYPEDTPAQMAVAAYMMALRYTQKEIAQARQVVLEDAPVPVAVDMESYLRMSREEFVRIAAIRTYAKLLKTFRAEACAKEDDHAS